MTPAEKAKETRRRHKESRDRKVQTQKRITEAIIQGCLSVLEDESSSADQKLAAGRLLSEVMQR